MATTRSSVLRGGMLPAPAHVPPTATVSLTTKLKITIEILASYPSLLRTVRSNDLEVMVAQARVPASDASPVAPERAEDVAVRLGIYVQRVLTPLPTDSRCLVKSLVLLQMLSRRSIDARLIIGARTDDGFAAHAWVVCGNRPILPAGPFMQLVEL